MEIKREVIEVLQNFTVCNGTLAIKVSTETEGVKEILFGNATYDIIADKLIAIFNKEKKQYALEMCKQTIKNCNQLLTFNPDAIVTNKIIPSELTATNLEGEK